MLGRAGLGITLAGLLLTTLGIDRGVAEQAVLRIAGSTTVLPVMSRAAEQFMMEHPDARITVNAGGSGVGIQGVGTGRLDIGMASRAMTPKEAVRFPGLSVLAVGRDAVACVVSSEVYDAGMRVLSRQQIRDIYLGRITNWKEVGGPDRPIVVIDKERHRGTRHVFMEYLFGDPQARAPGARLVTGSNNEEQTKIAQSNSAIGMLSFAWLNDQVKAVGIRDGDRVIWPTPETIASGEYPIARDLNLLIPQNPSSLTQKFIHYIKSPQGEQFVKESGYLPISAGRTRPVTARFHD